MTPTLHGVIDYLFSGVQLALPANLGLNTTATRTYQALGTGFLVMNALTDTPVGIKPMLSLKAHQRADAALLTGLSLLTVAPFIGNDRRALTFHLGFLATAIAHYMLTDYEANSSRLVTSRRPPSNALSA